MSGVRAAPSAGVVAEAGAGVGTEVDAGVGATASAARATFAADVGGTWTRYGDPSSPERRRTVATVSRLHRADLGPTQLRDAQVAQLAALAPPGAVAAVSFGAALDESRGVAYGSAPLWGDEGGAEIEFDLLGALTRRRPDVTWRLVNDVTAALVDFARSHARAGTRRVGYLTVSSGIAYRQADWRTRTVAVDARGLQGEVGHAIATLDPGIDAVLSPRQLAALPCDCGGRGHLASISSGPGLMRLARAAGLPVRSGPGSATDFATDFAQALAAGDALAAQVLRTVVAPIAEFVRMLWRVDPHLDLIGVGGGVAEGLGRRYRDELTAQLSDCRSYAEPARDDHWLASRLVVCAPGAVDPLAGAAAFVDGAVRTHR